MEIPGFSKYKINRDCELFSVYRNRLMRFFKSERNAGPFYNVYDDGGNRIRISAARLCYGAVKRIDPTKIPGNYILSFKDGVTNMDNIVVEDRSICGSRIRKIALERLKPMDEFYNQCIRFCEAARNKDVSALHNIVEENKVELERYLNRLVGFRKSKDLYLTVVSYFISGVMSGRLRTSNAAPYLFVLARKFAKAYAYEKSRIKIESRVNDFERMIV